MRTLILALLMFAFGQTVIAYEPVEMAPPTSFDIYTVSDITEEIWYVGVLQGFPHTFEFKLVQPTRLDLQVMAEPETEKTSLPSLIAIKEVERGVTEVMRRTADKETWTSYKDSISKLSFTESTAYSEVLEPGVYRVEVSNPLNLGKYVLKMGTEDVNDGYFDTLGDIAQMRSYFGYRKFGMILNPYVFIPIFVLLSFGFFGWYFYRRRG